MFENNRDPEYNGQDAPGISGQRTLVHRILRYVPNLLRDEWVNIGVLLYDPNTGERRLRLIEEEAEFNRVRRLHPRLDEESLRGLRDHLESRFGPVLGANGNGGGPGRSNFRSGEGNPKPDAVDWLSILEKWDATLSQSLQMADPKATIADDLDEEADRLYDERIAVPRRPARIGRPATRPQMRGYCSQVFRQARIWDRIGKRLHASEFTYEGDPMRLDYGYRRNGTRGFVQTISVTRAPSDAKLYADAARHIIMAARSRFDPEFTAVTDVALDTAKPIHNAVHEALGEFNITAVPLDNFAVWVAKLRPLLQ